MKKFYDKHELAFAIVWIVIYVNLFSMADGASRALGVEKLVTFPVAAAMSLLLLVWLRRHSLFEKYGLCAPRASARQFLYYLPLLLIVSCNAWLGLRMNMSAAESALYVLTMICVGFLEELIFRGFLFKAMCRDGVKAAIIVSSISFGIGHIVNLFNGSGAELPATLCQICYAMAAGFMFVIIFYRGGSLLPCIAAHSGINALSAFGVEAQGMTEIWTALALCVISGGYAIVLLHTLPKKEERQHP